MTNRSLAAASLATALLVASPPDLRAKPPTLTGFFPAGAERGRTLTVRAAGTFDHWPVQCWVEKDAGLTVKVADKKNELAFEVAADARPGVRWVRLYDEEGATSLRPFHVGALPELTESEPNDDPRRPQAIEQPRVVLNGRLEKSGDVDGFAVKLDKGRTLAADLEADRLGSPMDAVLQVVSAEGFVLAQNNDAIGPDPRIIFEAPATGTYIVRLFAFPSTPDSSIRFAGGPAYVYRLTLTIDGFIEHAFPLAASRENPTPVAAVGPNIAEADSALVVPSDDRLELVSLSSPALAGAAAVRRVAGAVEVEVEPNDPAKPQPLADRGAVSGRIDPPGDRDAYRIALKKGEKRRFRLESRAFGLPLDAVLQILGPDGKTLAELDDVRGSQTPDPELVFTPRDDGDYVVAVHDLNRRGGPNYAYLLSVVAPDPDFAMTLAADVFNLTPGKEAKVVVAIDRKNDHGEPIEVTAEGLPAGVTATTALSTKSGASAKSVTIELKGGGEARSGPFRIVGRSPDHRSGERAALAKITGFRAETDRPWLTILPPSETKK